MGAWNRSTDSSDDDRGDPRAAPEQVTAEERQLVAAVKRDDRTAFAAIIERHQVAVFGFLRARVLQPSDAEDMTQEVFLRCYLRRANFDSSAMLRPWLLGIAKNLLREHARKLRRRKEVAWTELCLELDDMVADDGALYDELLVHLPECLNTLGESARQAIDMRYVSKLRLADIGERLHRSEGAAKLLMFRARQALKSCLDRKARNESHDG